MIIITISKHKSQHAILRQNRQTIFPYATSDRCLQLVHGENNKSEAYYVINIKAKTFSHTYQIRHSGEGLLITPAEHSKLRGFYVKHDEKVFQGKGILHGLFGQIPLLNLLI